MNFKKENKHLIILIIPVFIVNGRLSEGPDVSVTPRVVEFKMGSLSRDHGHVLQKIIYVNVAIRKCKAAGKLTSVYLSITKASSLRRFSLYTWVSGRKCSINLNYYCFATKNLVLFISLVVDVSNVGGPLHVRLLMQWVMPVLQHTIWTLQKLFFLYQACLTSAGATCSCTTSVYTIG